MPERRVLVVYAHANDAASRVNRSLRAAVDDLDGVLVHDVYEAHPEFFIDPKPEQARLNEHDVVILQHPLQWYGAPAILKEWIDSVLEEGWAYGEGGKALAGKSLLSAVTCGGTESMYRRDGRHRFSIHEFLRPFEQTARYCGMHYLPPFVTFGARRLSAGAIATRASEYRALVERLARGALPAPLDTGLDRG